MTDAEFLKALCSDIEKLTECGFSDSEVRKMVAQRSYVRIWCGTPQWLEVGVRLPKGLKWKDGIKLRYGGKGKRSVSNTYQFIPHEEDLFFKGFVPIGAKVGTVPTCRIIGFRKMTASEVVFGMFGGKPSDPDFESAIRTVWNEMGLRQLNAERVTRSILRE